MTGKPFFYFAYGSNMNPQRMLSRQALFTAHYPARLQNYRLVFNKVANENPLFRAANIEATQGLWVEGLAYQLNHASLLHLDQYENYPSQYQRIKVAIEIGNQDQQISATTYIANAEYISPGRPSKAYLAHLLAAKEWLSPKYYRVLSQTQTHD